MEFELPATIAMSSKAGDRLVLVRSMGEEKDYVTVDFEWRRWQLGLQAIRSGIRSPAIRVDSVGAVVLAPGHLT
jgi:hypothetical protein